MVYRAANKRAVFIMLLGKEVLIFRGLHGELFAFQYGDGLEVAFRVDVYVMLNAVVIRDLAFRGQAFEQILVVFRFHHEDLEVRIAS